MATMSGDDLKTTSRKVSEKQKWNISSFIPSLPAFFTKRASKKRREGARERQEEENVPDAQQSNSCLVNNSQVDVIGFYLSFQIAPQFPGGNNCFFLIFQIASCYTGNDASNAVPKKQA